MANIKAWSSKRGEATHYLDPLTTVEPPRALCGSPLRIVVGVQRDPLTYEQLRRLKSLEICDGCQQVQRKRRAVAVAANRKADNEHRRRRSAAKRAAK